jgi:hypothetical protein
VASAESVTRGKVDRGPLAWLGVRSASADDRWSWGRRPAAVVVVVVVAALVVWHAPWWLRIFVVFGSLWSWVVWRRGTAGRLTAVVMGLAALWAASWSRDSVWHQVAIDAGAIAGWWIWVSCPLDRPIWQHVQARIAWVLGPPALLVFVLAVSEGWLGPQLGSLLTHGLHAATGSASQALSPHLPSLDVSGWVSQVRQHLTVPKGGGGR